jgi:hypothetical protein
MTPRGGERAYVVCLDCGRQLHYDLDTMRLGVLKDTRLSEPPPLSSNPSLLQNVPVLSPFIRRLFPQVLFTLVQKGVRTVATDRKGMSNE